MAASREVLNAVHEALAKELLAKITSGEAPASLLKEAREFLKDNNISAPLTPTNPLGRLAEAVPFPTEADVAH